MVEEIVGWTKTIGLMRKTRHKGMKRGGRMLTFTSPPGEFIMKKTVRRLVFPTLLLIANITFGQWSTDPLINTPVSTAANNQYLPSILSDGAGGAFITWYDNRSGNYDIYVQRINSSGVVQWTGDGVAVCTAANTQQTPIISSDGSGGAIIVWEDFRSGTTYDIYAQRINASGLVQWTADGVAISAAPNDQRFPTIVGDGSGGAIIAWHDFRNGNFDIYAQRINSSGAVQWTGDGAAICTFTGAQQYPTIASDGSGGAVITWQDLRGSSNDIYAQRINGAGAVQWTADGVAICTNGLHQMSPTIVRDGTGGAIITWYDFRNGNNNYDIYAQRINASGVVQWAADGISVCTATGSQSSPLIVDDGSGGAIIAWRDLRNGIDADIYAQRVNAAGIGAWALDGVAISTAANGQILSATASDGLGGAIFAWVDYRTGTNSNVYAQRISASGVVQWTANGSAVSTASDNQLAPVVTSDGSGGAIIVWGDGRNGSSDIYAQNIDRFGYPGINTPRLTKVHDVRGDQGGRVTVAWDRAQLDASPNQVITYYSIWRGIEPSAIPAGAAFIVPEEMHRDYNGKAYRTMRSNSVTTNWEWLANVPAAYFPAYSYTAATLADSGPGGTPYHKFTTLAHTANQFIFWQSNIDSGYSVDNIAPSGTTILAATLQAGPSVAMHWNPDVSDPDVGYYEIHRSTSSNFTPTPGTKIGQTPDTMSVDNAPVAGTTNYYRIVTLDIHGNPSVPSPQASIRFETTQLYSFAARWNMVSVPLTVINYSKAALYPTSVSPAFAFEGSYILRDTLANHTGYWMKFNGIQQVSMTGYLRQRDTVNVSAGWNLIGSISSQIATNQVTSNPPGMITSHFFGYSGAYSIANSIEPGSGYWVKVNQNGALILSSSPTIAPANRIRIVPTNELPPAPPEEESSNLKSQVPNGFALEQNFPNPFNPSTVIRYGVPAKSHVSLQIYDILGRLVSTLVDETQDPGFKQIGWNAGAVPSGVYFYKLEAGAFLDVKQMILLR